jgi:hypothetical protein
VEPKHEKFYRSIVEQKSLSSYSLSKIEHEIHGWMRFFNNVLPTAEHNNYLDGNGLL